MRNDFFLPIVLHHSRAPTNTSELASLEASTNVMKILSDQELHQDILGSKLGPALPTSDSYTTLTSVAPDSYDKQELNNIFDCLMQKWPESGTFNDPSNEVSRVSLFKRCYFSPFFINTLLLHSCQTLSYGDPFPDEQSSPVYSGSYSDSPPERFRSEFQFSLGAPPASAYKSTELPMVYLNKGQFYPITLQGVDSACLTGNKVKVRTLKPKKQLFQVASFLFSQINEYMHSLHATKPTLPKYLSLPWRQCLCD